MSMFKDFFIGFKKGQKAFGENIGIVINSILLTIVYIFGVGITSVIGKIGKKKFLEGEASKGTYWLDFNLGKKKMEEYYRQF